MKKIFLSALFIAFVAAPAFSTNDGGRKKKAKKKAKLECKKETCDPRNCDPKNCDPKCCNYEQGTKELKCAPSTTCTGS